MAANRIPTWPGDTAGPRVLLECEDPSIQDGLERGLRDHGYAVAVCGGPETRSGGCCPLVAGGRCGLIEDADVIVHALDPKGTVHRDVLAAIGEHRPDVPLVVEVVGTAEMHGTSPARAVPVRYPMTTDSVVAAVREVWPGA